MAATGSPAITSTKIRPPDLKTDASGHTTEYGYLRKNSATVAVGDTVEAGAILRVVGSSGCSSRRFWQRGYRLQTGPRNHHWSCAYQRSTVQPSSPSSSPKRAIGAWRGTRPA